MKISILCSATLFACATFAFPANLLKGDISEATLSEITSWTEKITRNLEAKRQGRHVKRAFNAQAQLISTTGDHKYVWSSTEGSSSIRVADSLICRSRQVPMICVDLALA